jgi:ABC-type nitrate/sulfonate/bicarbonate transport system ATPase subunit
VPGLRVERVSKAFRGSPAAGAGRNGGETGRRDLRVLDEISFAVEPEQIVGIIGPSGCGKTTLLKILAGLETADAGAATLNGSAVTRPRPDIAIVFQLFNLFPWRTVLGNVEFGLQMQRVPAPERRERAARLVAMVGLAGFEHYFPHQLSGGMQQRVGLARALAIDPALLLLDEPFGALDYQTAERLREELLRIQSQTAKMMVLVTHNIDEALYLCDRVLVFSSRPGRVTLEIEPRFPTPRWAHDIYAVPEFTRLRAEIKALVMGAEA